MKSKVITFLVSMGIPVSAISSSANCTGICGNCQLSCFPGVVALIILGAKALGKKIAHKGNVSYE